MEVLLAESTFDGGGADFDGWTAFECGNPGACPHPAITEGPLPVGAKFHHLASGGPAGVGDGNLEIIDPMSGSTGLFNAPGKFTSVLAPGLWFSFDQKITGPEFDNNIPPPGFRVSAESRAAFLCRRYGDRRVFDLFDRRNSCPAWSVDYVGDFPSAKCGRSWLGRMV